MDKNFKLTDNGNIVRYVKIILIGLLTIIEIIICAQYVEQYMLTGHTGRLIAVIASCVVLAVTESVNSFVIVKAKLKFTLFGLESGLLLVLCIFTGSTYLAILYAMVLTQIYVSEDNLRKNSIIFGVSCAIFTTSLILGKAIVSPNNSLYGIIVEILGDTVSGLTLIGIDFIVTNFILRFYSTNIQLRRALKEADDSKAQLKTAYEELSRTAVYEERNRIAKDIHDNAGHSMTTVIMQTEAAKLLIDQNPEEAKMRIISANMQAKNALEQMRESVHLLAGRANVRSIREEIEEIIAQTIDGTGLKIRSNIEDIVLGDEADRLILNTVKECIANGIRHGGATAFFIEMRREDDNIFLLVSDNGKGTGGEIAEGFGLRGIREKVLSFGGTCVYESEPDEGFETKITLPYKKGDNND